MEKLCTRGDCCPSFFENDEEQIIIIDDFGGKVSLSLDEAKLFAKRVSEVYGDYIDDPIKPKS